MQVHSAHHSARLVSNFRPPQNALFVEYPYFLQRQFSETIKQRCIKFIYRVIQEESARLREMIVCVILNKKVHMNMGPILNGYGVMTAYNLE